MMNEHDREQLRRRYQAAAVKCGVEDPLVLMFQHYDDDLIDLTIEHHMKDLSFAILAKLSEKLGTRDISVGCDLGTSSDRTHDPCIFVRGIKTLVAE